MIVTLTGTGTSHGIPVIGCECPVCRSSDPHDTRLRCSAYIQAGDTALVIDTGPEFRMQALKYNIKHLDAVLLTHSHADHLNGLDDLRIFSHTASPGKNNRTEHILPVYANGATLRDIQTRFSYVFAKTQQGGGKPLLDLFNADEYTKENPVVVQNILCFPLPMKHGALDVIGWNIREHAQTTNEGGASTTPTPAEKSVASATATCKADKAAHSPEKREQLQNAQPQSERAQLQIAQNSDQREQNSTTPNADKSQQSTQNSFTYLTDCSEVPDETVQLIQGTEHLVIDGLRKDPHPTHFSFLEALECAAKIRPKHVWLTHITHNNSHEQINEWLSINKKQFPALADIPVHAAYDGLKLTL